MMTRHITAALLAMLLAQTALAQTADSTLTADNDEVTQLREEVAQLREEQDRTFKQLRKQSRQEDMWPKSSPIMISYGNQTLEDEALGVKYKSDLSLSVSKRHTYDLHRSAIAGMVKIGLDVSWFDVSVARYEKGKGLSLGDLSQSLMGNVTSGVYGSFEDYFNTADNKALAASDHQGLSDIINRVDLGKFQISANVVGIGPSVRVAPFYPIGKRWLDKIKVGFYFHYLPTFSALVFTSENEDPVVCGGYMSCWRYGGNITFGRIGIGVEHQWGEGKLKKFNFGSDDDDEGINITSEKVNYLVKGTRFYVGFRF